MVQTGSGDYLYEVVDDWPSYPEELGGFDVLDLGFDKQDRLFVLNFSDQPLILLDADGSYLTGWGTREEFPHPHGVTMGLDDETIWLTDKLDHSVRQYTYDGKLLKTLGTSRTPAPAFSSKPFNQCTHLAIDPNTGFHYVSDGYMNAAVHKFDENGRHIKSWGEPGFLPGQFCLPHNVIVDRQGLVYVADRHNSRVQIFDSEGELVDIWYGMGLPCGLHLDSSAEQEVAYVLELSTMAFVAAAAYGAELGSPAHHWIQQPGTSHKVTVRTLDGTVLATMLDNGIGPKTGQLAGPHALSVDSIGNVVVAELPAYQAKQSGATGPLRNIVRLERIAAGA